MTDRQAAWIEAHRAAGLCPVTAALERAMVLALAGSSEGRDAWMAVAQDAAREMAGGARGEERP